MIIKSAHLQKMEHGKLQEKSGSGEMNTCEIKDEVHIKHSLPERVLLKSEDVLKGYKELKEHQTEDKEQPWWGEFADFCHVQADVVEGIGMKGALHGASVIGSGLGSIGLGAFGAMELKEGLSSKDTLKVIGGTSAILAGAASGADFLGNIIEGHGLFGTNGHAISGLAETSAKVFGIAHGTIDVALGGREVIHGIKEKNRDKIIDGSLDIGIGSTMVMGALGIGGAPMAVALGGLFVTKLAYNHRNVIKETGKEILEKMK
ncbi:MAG: hypothetical protein ABRQ37_25090 [Candidatus Eremiobacterota bacterium]